MVSLMLATHITIPEWEAMGPAVIATAVRELWGVDVQATRGIDPNTDKDW